MDSARFSGIVERYSGLRIAVLGDFCLDRYLEIDPSKAEVSLETGLPVHNVMNVRAQPSRTSARFTCSPLANTCLSSLPK